MTTTQAAILLFILIGIAFGTLGTLVRINYVINQVDTLSKRVAGMGSRLDAIDKDLRG